MLDLLIIRHAESEGNRDGAFGGQGPTPLSAHGRAQAQRTAEFLATEFLAQDGAAQRTAIWSSDLPRALETARPLAERLAISLETTPALRERDIGVFTGLSFVEAERRYPDAYRALRARDPSVSIPGAEAAEACAERAAALCARAIAQASGTQARVLLFSHAYAINLLLRRLLRIGEGTPEIFLHTDNAAIHRLRLSSRGTLTLRALNERHHLHGL